MKEDLKTPEDEPLLRSDNLFPVVGVGASAGGLDVFKRFIKAIPVNSGMAYVLVQHLSRDHESLLPGLLQKITSIPVIEITDEIKVQPDHIYIIPSNTMLVANDGVLQLSQRPAKNKEGLNLPIDLFFSSLAEVHLSHSIGVVLSGTGADGTTGLKAIKENGGITCVQDPLSAEYPEMPESAINAGVADFILKPEEIPLKLFEIKELIEKNDAATQNDPEENESFIKQILFILRLRRGTDFSDYKRPTIIRRIFRRMIINKQGDYNSYIKLLVENKSEQDFLYNDMLIQVTSFFRDVRIFDMLCDTVFPAMVRQSVPDSPIRIWIAGCSSGEEAYSMAMCFRESLGDDRQEVQIFATDISEPAIEKARAGFYTKKEAAGIKPERLRIFFTKTSDGYRINKQIREMCIFAVHNFVKDPPFSKINLVSCRNVLIYMEPYLQKKALTNFHYSLVPKGTLLLGKAEAAGIATELFAPLHKNEKMYSRKDAPAKFVHVANQIMPGQLKAADKSILKQKPPSDFQKSADEIILQRFTPAGVVINESLDIVHFRGNTAPYLQQAEGRPSHNILRMAKNAISFELRNMLLKLKKENLPVIKENIRVDHGDYVRIITIEIIPIKDLPDPHCLVLFQEGTPLMYAVPPAVSSGGKEEKARISQLEKELEQNLEDMRNITEDQENANNELQSANEELLSGSEELQSLNEELETSKEELQSTNEELTVLNQELISLNEQLHTAVNDQEVTQKKMEIQAEMVENLLMTAPVFVCTMTGPEHRYEMINDRYQNLFGKRAIKGKPVMKALPELEGQGLDKLLDNVYTTGVPYVGIEIPITLARDIDMEPEDRFFNFSFQPVYDGHKAINAILCFGYEVTDEVNAKKLIDDIGKQHGVELSQIIVRRTAELGEANKELNHKNDKLIAINNELESFTFISSHDLQEPLRKIQMLTDKIETTELERLSETGKDYFNRINKAANKMQALLKDLLEYSRASIAERAFEQTDLQAIIDELKTEFEDVLQKENAVIKTSELGEARIIPFQFKQLFHNLISNSLKFCRAGTLPVISIKKAKGTTGKETITLIYSDNGIGFDPAYNEKVFEVFQRLNAKELYAGTGIGLAIVKKIVKNHKGTITASGRQGEGVSFAITIPA